MSSTPVTYAVVITVINFICCCTCRYDCRTVIVISAVGIGIVGARTGGDDRAAAAATAAAPAPAAAAALALLLLLLLLLMLLLLLPAAASAGAGAGGAAAADGGAVAVGGSERGAMSPLG